MVTAVGTQLRKNGFYFVFIVLFSMVVFADVPSSRSVNLGDINYKSHRYSTTPVSPYFMITLDAAGYSDWLLYGYSPEHPESYHELLCGEWGAAVYYDGIDTAPVDPNNPSGSRKAMWLTNWFSYPDWATNSVFDSPVSKTVNAWDDPANPVSDTTYSITDTAISYIQDDCLEVRIDYEVADLDTVDPNLYSAHRSPMAFLDPETNLPAYINSDRYVILQTYTFRNIDPNQETLTNLEFYQMLHGHGADEYGPGVNSCYEIVSAPDALQYYQPRNSIHQVGNFRYDITQWNSQPFILYADHTDYVGFSSTREPDWIDNDVYEGGHWYERTGGRYKPPQGTHYHIENRQLNGVEYLYRHETAGAMGWNLGSLDPNETTSITIAYMFAMEQENNSSLSLEKSIVNPQSSYSPGDEFTYDLSWGNIGDVTAQSAVLKDYLPAGVDFVGFISSQSYFLPAPSDPNIVFALTDDNGLSDIILPVGQSITVYLTKETPDINVYCFSLEANISDPNLGWIDNTEYDPNDPNSSTAEILATPRTTAFDYFGPGVTQEAGIQFFAANFNNPINDGDLASFVYTATQPGYVVLTLVNYDENSATLEEIVIRQTDPNDPNNIPSEPNSVNEPPVYSASSPTGSYDSLTHTITWQLGDLTPGASGNVQFEVRVNQASEPGMMLRNEAKLSTSIGMITRELYTQVSCWDNDDGIIYVDWDAKGNNNGTDWQNAYTDLNMALDRAAAGCNHIIYVASGIYSPGRTAEDTFEIPSGVSVYGGFAGWETSPDQRQIQNYPTVLSGYNEKERNKTVVTMGGNDTLLDGVIVQDAGGIPQSQGILCEGVSTTITNCVVKNNIGYGLYADNSNVSIKWSSVENNQWDGIYHLNGETSLIVENCQINRNKRNGINDANSIPTIRNNVICENGMEDMGYRGIFISDPKGTPLLYNNTIAYNYNEAIAYIDSDPNHDNLPDAQNCIIWYNNNNGEQFAGWKVYPHYSCVYDPNDPDGVSQTIDFRNNFSHKPDFAYPHNSDPNILVNVHLAYDSFCKNKGNPNLTYADQNDIDAEYRVADGRVDAGADEISCENIYNVWDWNADGMVGMYEFGRFSKVWLAHDPNDPAVLDPNNPVNDPNSSEYIRPEQREAWYPDGWKFNLVTDNNSAYSIDVADLLGLLNDSPWLWTACWRHDIEEYLEQVASQQSAMMLSASLESQSSSESLEATSVSSATTFSALSTAQSSVEEISVEEFDPVAEREQVLSLLEDIAVFIDAGGEDAPTWQEIKILLEQNLTELENMAIETTEF